MFLSLCVISEISLGYSTIKDEWDKKNQVRRLKELKLYEVSPVTFPAKEQTRILNVKSMQSHGSKRCQKGRKMIHQALSKYRIRKDREFFMLDFKCALEIICK